MGISLFCDKVGNTLYALVGFLLMISYIYGMKYKIDKFTANQVFLGVILILIFSSSALYAEVGVLDTLRADDFFSLLEENLSEGNGIILDVRTPGEYEAGNAPGSVSIDFYDSDFRNTIDALDKNEIYFLYCQSGNRNGKTLRMMKNLGFVEVHDLSGGWSQNTARLLALDNE